MANPALFKRWKISEALLKRAYGTLPLPLKNDEESFRVCEKEFLEYLEHNEHELALDMVQELGGLVEPRGAFWKDLIRAAENMELVDRVPYFQKQYHEALSRLSENEKA